MELVRSLVQGREARFSLGQGPESGFDNGDVWDQGDDGGDNDFSLIGDDFEPPMDPGVNIYILSL